LDKSYFKKVNPILDTLNIDNRHPRHLQQLVGANTCIVQNMLSIQFHSLVKRQFQLLIYVCRGRQEVMYHIADYAEKF
jgi:hypothetical protein